VTRLHLVVIALTLGLASPEAVAGNRWVAWVWDTQVLPERALELEWWLWERTGGEHREAVVSFSGVVGLTDRLEVALPFDVAWRPEAGTQLESAGVDLRWRLASPDPARAGPVVPLVRVGVRRMFQADAARLEGDGVLSIDVGPLHSVLDAGAVGETGAGDVYLTFGGGLSYGFIGELRAGIEAYAEVALDGEEGRTWAAVGPSLSFTHGRFWVTASVPIGLGAGPDLLPRVIWAAAF
jgi:hypothetical protein